MHGSRSDHRFPEFRLNISFYCIHVRLLIDIQFRSATVHSSVTQPEPASLSARFSFTANSGRLTIIGGAWYIFQSYKPRSTANWCWETLLWGNSVGKGLTHWCHSSPGAAAAAQSCSASTNNRGSVNRVADNDKRRHKRP